MSETNTKVKTRCSGPGCDQELDEQSPSEFFCSSGCQSVWHANRCD